jgi:hypothetical protein
VQCRDNFIHYGVSRVTRIGDDFGLFVCRASLFAQRLQLIELCIPVEAG